MYYQTNTAALRCTANISANRNRVKQYSDTVFLNNGQSFEIELFNPKRITVLAKISINGRSISNSGIVIKPGQRVFLERFLDSAKRFKFETYEVEDSNEARAAIESNGEIRIDFFNEVQTSITSSYSEYTYFNGSYTTGSPLPYNPLTTTCQSSPSTLTVNTSNSLNSAQIYSNVAGSIETGRVEAGENSNQRFDHYAGLFNWLADQTEVIKVKPLSQKPVEMGEIRNYCTGCSTRIKKSTWKFCPTCGTKIND